jgi:hypothetical protein
MNNNDADQLSTLITRNFRNGLNPTTWHEHLQHEYSNAERARTAIRKLIRENVHAPSIAEFHTTYLQTADPTTERLAGCYNCDNTGYQFIEAEHSGKTYSYVTPCLDANCDHAAQATKIVGKTNAERSAA